MEQRQYPRHEPTERIEALDKATGASLGTLKDISRYGCCLVSEEKHDFDHARYVVLKFPGREVEIIAKAVRAGWDRTKESFYHTFGMMICLVEDENWDFIDSLSAG